MKKKKIVITGQNGFIGQHLYSTLKLYPEKYIIKDFDRKFFNNPHKLENVINDSDVIIHLAGLNRHKDENVIYSTNILLVDKIINVLINKNNSKTQLIMSSSTQENEENKYGKSKKDARKNLDKWSYEHKESFVGMLIPNVFGPFCLPNYNSYISTFSNEIINGKNPKIIKDKVVNLIYVGELVREIIKNIDENTHNPKLIVKHTKSISVSNVLDILNNFKTSYIDNGTIPKLNSLFKLQLFNTFRSYINYKNFFPIKYIKNTDSRGSFIELLRSEIGGQVSYSTTKPNIVRGNHFHTRKIERFSVIEGKALIQLRRVGTDEVLEFYLDGKTPSYVDIPIWYIHNIKNIGNKKLFTNFWINEPYNSEDSDTYFIEV